MSANLSRQGSQSSMTTYATVAVASTAISVAGVLYYQNLKEQKKQEIQKQKIKEAKKKFIHKMLVSQFVKDSDAIKFAYKEGGDVKARDVAFKRLNNGMEAREVKACYNEFDEMYEREVETVDNTSQLQEKDEKPKKEYWASEHIVNLGDPDYDVGKAQVTIDLFDKANDKVKNCETFIDNYDRIRRRHLEDIMAQEANVLETEQGETPDNENETLMDVDHGKFKKKDHIFMGLFSMYGKSYIQKKRKQEPKRTIAPIETVTPKQQTENRRLLEESTDKTPLYEKNKKRIQMMQKREIYDKNKYNNTKSKGSKTQRTPQPVNNIYEKITQAQKMSEAHATKS